MPFRQPLKNCLKDYKGKCVKIHAEQGSNFVYCDKVSSKTEKELIDISVNYLAWLKRKLTKAQYTLKNIDLIYDNKISKQKEKAKVSVRIRKKLNDYIAKMEKKKAKQLVLLPTVIMSLRKQVSLYTPLTERNVVDIYPSISPDEMENTYIIVIRGHEQGKYWTIKEYQDRDLPTTRGLHEWQNKKNKCLGEV